MQENLLSLSIQPFLNALNDDSITTRSSLSDDLEQFFVQELPPSTIQPIRLAGSYRCWFVKKYCWLVCVREKYCSGWKYMIVYDKPQPNEQDDNCCVLPSAIIVLYFRSMFHTEKLKLRGLVFITIKVYKMPPSCPPLYPSHILTALPSGELISVYHYFQ